MCIDNGHILESEDYVSFCMYGGLEKKLSLNSLLLDCCLEYWMGHIGKKKNNKKTKTSKQKKTKILQTRLMPAQ